jgi:TIR domain-containing protein
MSVSMARSTVARLQKEIADLRAKDAQEAKRESDLTAKMVKASNDARTTKSVSTATSKLNEASRASNEIASVQKKRADLSKSLASKTSDLHRAQTTLEKTEDSEHKKVAADQRKSDDAREKKLKALEQELLRQRRAAQTAPLIVTQLEPNTRRDAMLPSYDVFVSHASEDKESFVRPFAEKLLAAGVTPFYDEMTLAWGDSLRRRIEEGLARSRFGVVVLSKHFFAKEWPQRELDGLVQLEIQGHARILPIWHEISKDEVTRFSPMLADKLALSTALLTVDEIVAKLVEVSGKR